MRDAIAMGRRGPATQCIERIVDTAEGMQAQQSCRWRVHYVSKSWQIPKRASTRQLVNTATQIWHKLYVLADHAYR